MGSAQRKHTRFYHDIWGDDDWRDLSPEAQHLYFVLYTWPPTFCGAGDWKPKKIAARAKGWTEATVLDAGEELLVGEFLLIDVETEEHLLRSWIKHDGLYRNANMAVSMANARAELASKNLRGVVVHEVAKLKKAEPKLDAWGRDAVAKMLDQNAIDPGQVDWASPWDSSSVSPSVRAKVRPKGTQLPCTCDRARATPLLPSSSSPADNSKEGYVSRERHLSVAEDSNAPFKNRCLIHASDPNPPTCGMCADVRKADEALQRSLKEAADKLRRDFWQEVRACEGCDEYGWETDDEGSVADNPVRCPLHDWSVLDAA